MAPPRVAWTKRTGWAVCLVAAWLVAGCVNPSGGQTTADGLAAGTVDGTLSFDSTQTAQTIDGFGGSTAWTFSVPSDAVLQALFDPATGAGLTLVRNRIPFRDDVGNAGHTGYADGFVAKSSGAFTYTTNSGGHKVFNLNWSSGDIANTKRVFAKAVAYSSDIRGFSTAWTPPNNGVDKWKIDSGTNTVGGSYGTSTEFPSIGGILDPNHYQDYADVLADYASGFQANMGYPLAGISVQNEPNFLPKTYESCGWTAAQFAAFVPLLNGAWANKSLTTTVILPESFSFTEDLVAPLLAGGTSAPAMNLIVGVHQYNASGISNPGGNYAQATSAFKAVSLPATATAGKRLWETEVSSTSAGANDPSIQDGLYWARMVHADLLANVSAFCAWWLWYASPAALVDTTTSPPVYNKRLYTLGQFSRYVRPGWVRVTATTDPATMVQASVFRNADSSQFAVVLINYGTSDKGIKIGGSPIATAKLSRTSATENLVAVAELAVSSQSVSVPLPALSVSTVYGTLSSLVFSR